MLRFLSPLHRGPPGRLHTNIGLPSFTYSPEASHVLPGPDVAQVDGRELTILAKCRIILSKVNGMITDTEIKVKGIETLIKALGELNAERFITLLLREPFDYTRWQRNLWTDKSVEEVSTMAMQGRPTSDKLTD